MYFFFLNSAEKILLVKPSVRVHGVSMQHNTRRSTAQYDITQRYIQRRIQGIYRGHVRPSESSIRSLSRSRCPTPSNACLRSGARLAVSPLLFTKLGTARRASHGLVISKLPNNARVVLDSRRESTFPLVSVAKFNSRIKKFTNTTVQHKLCFSSDLQNYNINYKTPKFTRKVSVKNNSIEEKYLK